MADTPKWDETEEVKAGDVPKFEDTEPHSDIYGVGSGVEPSGLSNLWGLNRRIRETVDNPTQSAKDTGLGAVQGATFSLADEAEGLGKASLETIHPIDAIERGLEGKGDMNPIDPDFLEKYRKYQIEANKKYKEAEERSPVLNLAGNVIGGSIAAPYQGVLGLASRGGKAAVMAAYKAGGAKAASLALAKEAGKEALINAPSGALYGFGSSEGGLESPEMRDKLLGDTVSGAAFGSAAGGALGLAANGLPLVKTLGKDVFEDLTSGPLLRRHKQAYKEGIEGNLLGDENVRNKFYLKSGEFSEGLMGDLDQGKDLLGKEVGNRWDDAQAKGLLIDIRPDLTDGLAKIEKYAVTNPSLELEDKTRKLIEKVTTQKQQLTPEETRQLIKSLDETIDTISSDMMVPSAVKKTILDLRKNISLNAEGQIPGLKEANKNYANYMDSTYEQIMSGSSPTDVTNKFYGTTNNADNQVYNKIKQMVEGATRSGEGSREAAESFSVLKQKLEELERTNPKAFAAIGKSNPEIIESIKKAADTDAMIGEIHKVNPHTGIPTSVKGAVGGVGATGKAMSMTLANKVGYYGPGIMKGPKAVAGVVGDAVGGAGRLTKKALFDLPLESVSAVANHLKTSSSPLLQNLGGSLEKALQNNDAVAKSAILNSMMQNPNVRKMLDIQPDEDK